MKENYFWKILFLLAFNACLLSFTSKGFAYDQSLFFIQIDKGINGYQAQGKFRLADKFWALGVSHYAHYTLFGHTIDRETGEYVDPFFQFLTASTLWNRVYRWGYIDAGVGLGIGWGSWVNNCDDESAFVGYNSYCDFSSSYAIGIPFQATAVIGKYIGLGISTSLVISSEETFGLLSVTLPLGRFTRHD